MLQNWSPPRKITTPFFGQIAKECGFINNFQKLLDFVINSNLFHEFATKNSLPVAFGQGTRTNLRVKSCLSSTHSELFILLSSSTTGFTHVVNSPGPLETITTATDCYFIAVKPEYIKCGRRDLNSQGRSHTLLRRARLPIPPRPQRVFSNRGIPKP